MKISDKAENNSIDKYYEEEGNLSSEYDDKLRFSLEKMNILKEDPYDFNINISDIIDEGENIKAKRRDKIELWSFCGIALLIISFIFVSTAILGKNFLLYLQLIIFIIMPLLLIPIAKASKDGGKGI